MTERIIIKEVSARDGLQAQPKHLSVEQRQRLIASLVKTGVPEIEIGSFVSPKAVPQMAGTDQIAAALPETAAEYSALVPNMKGYELALKAGIRTHAIAISATEQMNQNNIRKSLAETFTMAEDILVRAREDGVAIHVYLAVAFECPYEGKVSPATVLEQAAQLMRNEPARLVIADTIGAADPASVRSLMNECVAQFGTDVLGCHFHDTRAMALANVYAGIESGIRQFDSSAGGLGGCPFAPGAKGNVATEDVVSMCEQMGLDTGVDIPALLESVKVLSELMESPQGGRSHYWLNNNWQKISRDHAA
ncbi:hydroxymethylglutaryl-CoA lyase [Luminiphilus syltensis NOR5-1B]|uniref:Hydroxymethylglutaryl-CoA lyase n=1 Tax=Luminiphilus syltensis NOR5-1B TaxID=565045 RepID=B8KY81_9GAMM|nr:hydroxymethylglutaryl-CoA lyase [Luminiphilus syltensis]EED35272.1 hydroxymethylglutaryl-CoA lyase [Luminiphilus syltensis NOR5-1B]